MQQGRWTELDRQVREDVRRHDFSERERLVLGVILDFSFACGRAQAVIPRLDDFVALTGISRGNVSDTLDALKKSLGVLVVEGTVYRVLPQSEVNVWRVRPKVDIGRADELSRQLRELNGVTQGELLPTEPTLAQARAEVTVECALEGTAKTPFAAMREAVEGRGGVGLARASGVPESGTPLEDLEASKRISKSSKTSKRGIDVSKLPRFAEHELMSVPDITTWSEVMGWLHCLELKHGGWMGTGKRATWLESYGGQWWPRFREDTALWRTVWNEALSMSRESRINDSIGGCAHDLWINQRVGS